MPAYGYIDESITGLIQGLDYEVEGRFAAAEAIGFGVGVFGYIGEDKKVGVYHLDTAVLVYDADLEASNVINVTVNGEAITPVTFLTTHEITMDLVVAAILALDIVDDAILDPDDGDDRTILIRVKFADAVASSVVTLGTGQAGATATYASAQVFMGASTFIQNSPGVYEIYDAVNILTSGMISVVSIEAVEAYAGAYIDIAGSDKGSWTNVAGLAVNARYTENASADGFTVLEVKGKTNTTYATYF